jgi:ribosomal protein S14
MTGIIAHCERCGLPRTIATRRDSGLCSACSYAGGHRCQRCGKPRGRHNKHPQLCGPCTREQTHTIALQAGQWVRDGLIWRWQPAPEPERCGTERGYHWHRKHDETICERCREAHRTYIRERRQEAA